MKSDEYNLEKTSVLVDGEISFGLEEWRHKVG